jgi:hypothetical protein
MKAVVITRCQLAVMVFAASCLLGGASEKPAGAASSPPPAPACQAQEDGGSGRATMAAVIGELRRREAGQAPGAVAVEALDNRGYGYGSDADPFAGLPIQEPRPLP